MGSGVDVKQSLSTLAIGAGIEDDPGTGVFPFKYSSFSSDQPKTSLALP